MNFGDIKEAAYRRLQESSTSPKFWVGTEVPDAVNEGYEDLAEYCEFHERVVSLNLVANQTYYDLYTLITDSSSRKGVLINLKRVANASPYIPLSPTSVHELDQHSLDWPNARGEPKRMFLRGIWQLGLFPAVSASSGTFNAHVSAIPNLLSADGDEPPFPEAFHEALIEYALYDLTCTEGEFDISMVHYARYLELREKLRTWVRTRVTKDMVLVPHG